MSALIVMGFKMGIAAGGFILMGKALSWYHEEREENSSQGGLRDGRFHRNFPR